MHVYNIPNVEFTKTIETKTVKIPLALYGIEYTDRYFQNESVFI